MIKLNISYVVSTLAILLVSCGGGSDSKPSAPAPAPVITTPAATITLSASSSSVELSNEFTLTWSSTNTTSCTASGDWSGDNGVSGTQAITSTSTGERSYVLTCTGDVGSASETVNVTILEPAPPTINFSATSSSVEQSNGFTLTWSSTDTTSCVASGDWSGDNDVSGTQPITSTSSGEKSFELTCSGDGGSASKTVILTVLEFSVVIATAKPNAATVKLLTEGFNQPLASHPQWTIFSSNIETYYVSRFENIINKANQSFGRYKNFNYLVFDLEGSDSVNQPVFDRLIELNFVGSRGGYTTEELKSVAGCLSGSNPNGYEKDANYEYHSICVTNIQFVKYSHGFFDPNYSYPLWEADLEHAMATQHEYFHHYQGMHALDRGLDFQSDVDNPDNTVNSPRWWTEGAPMAAEFWWLRSNWMMIDSLKDHPEVEPNIMDRINYRRNQSFWWFSQRLQKGPPYTHPQGFTNNFSDCSSWMMGPEHAYPWPLPESSDGCANDIAGIAPIHFMAHKSSWQAVLRDIPADYYEYGFWGAVEIHTGLNQQQFYAEFNAIMRSVDWTTMDRSYAPEGWNIPDASIEETVDFLNITPYSLEDIPGE